MSFLTRRMLVRMSAMYRGGMLDDNALKNNLDTLKRRDVMAESG